MATSISDRLRQLQQDKIAAPTPPEPEDARKARTHRLVQLGALAEQYLQVKGTEPAEFERFIAELVQLPAVDTYITTHRRLS